MKFSLPILFSIFLFSSCQKEFIPDKDTNNNLILNNDSNYIDKVVSIDSTGARVDSMIYKYDNLRRLISTKDSIRNSFYSKTYFYYNGTDSLPFKSVDTSNVTSLTIEVKYFFYNSSGLRIKDSIIRSFLTGLDYVRVSKYSYNGNKIFGITSDTNSYANKRIFSDTATLNANGNIVFSKRKKLYENPVGYSFPDSSISTITYDAKPSPYSRFKQFAFDIFPSGETNYTEIGQNNNVTIMDEHIYIHNSNNQVTDIPYYYNLTTNYIYNTNGFLKEIVDGGNKAVFYYRDF